MGFEYQIRHQPTDRERWQAFIESLNNPVSADGWTAFTTSINADGIYFCDFGRSDASSVALRRIIDEALSEGSSVVIEEL